MTCTLKKQLKAEHAKITKKQFEDTEWLCHLTSKQICHWCCLHIYRVAQPKTRLTATDFNPGYAGIADIVEKTDLDDVWVTCSQCGRGASD